MRSWINPRSAGRYGRLVERVERVTELPMILLSVIYVFVFAAGYLAEAGPGVREDALLVEGIIVAVFAAELSVKVAVARNRLAYLRENWLQVDIVVLPFLRPLRMLAVLRAVPFVLRGLAGMRRVMDRYQGVNAGARRGHHTGRHGAHPDLRAGLRRHHTELRRRPVGALVTVTTVGYEDTYPVTSAGRAVALFVMAVGIAVFGVLTAGIAAYFVESSAGEDRESDVIPTTGSTASWRSSTPWRKGWTSWTATSGTTGASAKVRLANYRLGLPA